MGEPDAKCHKVSHPVVSEQDWTAARLQLLEEEKALSRQAAQLSAKRRALPWRELKSEYKFHGQHGEVSFSSLFGEKDDLIVYHLMMAAGQEKPCFLCSFFIDQFQAAQPHLSPRCAFAVVAKAPYAELAAGAAKKDWSNLPLFSASDCSFNEDLGVTFSKEQQDNNQRVYNYNRTWPFGSDAPGLSCFRYDRASGQIYHTYSTFSAGLGSINQVLNLLDLTATGRQEGPSTEGGRNRNMWWVKHKEEY